MQQIRPSLIQIAREGRLVREDKNGPRRVKLPHVDESALELIDRAIETGRSINLVYPVPAGEVAVLLAAQVLIHWLVAKHTEQSVGIVTADTAQACRCWSELRIATIGSREPLSDVFPCYRAGPDGESPFGRGSFRGLLVGRQFADWPVRLVIMDCLAGPVDGTPRGVPVVRVFADPLDPTLEQLAERGELVWGWSRHDLIASADESDDGSTGAAPFSVAHERLRTMAKGVHFTIHAVPHPTAEAAVRRVRDDLRALRELTGVYPPEAILQGLRVAWHHLTTLTSLPCRPSHFDRFCGTPPWAARATSSFEKEIAAWARSLTGDAEEFATILASDLADLRASLENRHPFEPVLTEWARVGPEALVVVRTRTAARALAVALGCDPDSERAGCLSILPLTRLHLEGTWKRVIVVGIPPCWDWHRIDSGLSSDVHVLGLGGNDARLAKHAVELLVKARQRWANTCSHASPFREGAGSVLSPDRQEERVVDVEITVLEEEAGPVELDPFDSLDSLFVGEPLAFGEEGPTEYLAKETETGDWTGMVEGVEVLTDKGLIKLERGRFFEVRKGPRIIECRAEDLEPGMFLLLGRRVGRMGLIEALEGRLSHRPDLLAARLLIDRYKSRVRRRFKELNLTFVELHSRLARLGCTKTAEAVRRWVIPDGTMAPRDLPDLKRLDSALDLGLAERGVLETHAAVERWRNFRRDAGKMLAEAARVSTLIGDYSRVDPGTGLSIADLRDAVVEAAVLSVSPCKNPVPLREIGRLGGGL